LLTRRFVRSSEAETGVTVRSARWPPHWTRARTQPHAIASVVVVVVIVVFVGTRRRFVSPQQQSNRSPGSAPYLITSLLIRGIIFDKMNALTSVSHTSRSSLVLVPRSSHRQRRRGGAVSDAAPRRCGLQLARAPARAVAAAASSSSSVAPSTPPLTSHSKLSVADLGRAVQVASINPVLNALCISA